jgi:hypothetical protein
VFIKLTKSFLLTLINASCLCAFLIVAAAPVRPAAALALPQPFAAPGVAIFYKFYSAQESSRLLSRDLLRMGYQPIQISIYNDTDQTWQLAPDQVSLPSVSGNKIAKKIFKKGLWRSLIYKVGGLFFWPLMVPGVVDNIHTVISYRGAKKSLTAKGLSEELIAPYSTVHRVLYVPLDRLVSSFGLTLIAADATEQICFHTAYAAVEETEAATEA